LHFSLDRVNQGPSAIRRRNRVQLRPFRAAPFSFSWLDWGSQAKQFLACGHPVQKIVICGNCSGIGIGWHKMRTRIMNQLQALAVNEGKRWRPVYSTAARWDFLLDRSCVLGLKHRKLRLTGPYPQGAAEVPVALGTGSARQETQRPILMHMFSPLVTCEIDVATQAIRATWPQLRRGNEDHESSVGTDHRSKRVIVPLRSVQRDRSSHRRRGAAGENTDACVAHEDIQRCVGVSRH